MKALGIANEAALQNWFVRQVDQSLRKRGRRLVGWEEILQGGPLPADAVVSSWQGAVSAEMRAEAGHDVVLAIAPTLYFDNRQMCVGEQSSRTGLGGGAEGHLCAGSGQSASAARQARRGRRAAPADPL